MTTDVAVTVAAKPETVDYWAVSILRSRTFWVNTASFVVAGLSLTEVVTIIPPQHAPKVAALLGLLNVWLRLQSVRPVAFIGPNETKVVEVPRVGPPPPEGMKD